MSIYYNSVAVVEMLQSGNRRVQTGPMPNARCVGVRVYEQLEIVGNSNSGCLSLCLSLVAN